MKGVIGVVACDGKNCPAKFIQSEMQPAKGESVKYADAAERDSTKEGWTIELRTRAYHYCPVHTAQRKKEQRDRETKASQRQTEP